MAGNSTHFGYTSPVHHARSTITDTIIVVKGKVSLMRHLSGVKHQIRLLCLPEWTKKNCSTWDIFLDFDTPLCHNARRRHGFSGVGSWLNEH